jgi:hypothetical protein
VPRILLIHEADQVDEAEKETREKLRAGEYIPEETYLTRWNVRKRQVEVILGELKKRTSDPVARAIDSWARYRDEGLRLARQIQDYSQSKPS